jgi:hypothetical protein
MNDQTTDTSTSNTGSESQGSYVQSLIGPAGEQSLDTAEETTTQPQPAATTTETAPQDTTKPATETTKPAATKTAAATPSLDDLIQQFATETGLNPEDPAQRKTLKRLADKELFILKLQADNETLKTSSVAKPATEPEFLTDFEKELQAEGKPEAKQPIPIDGKKPSEETAKQPTAPAAAPTYGDVGDAWKTPEDSLTALNEAWAGNDLPKVHQIELARMVRNFDAVIAPSFLNHIGKMLDARLKGFVEKDLGDVVPEVRRTVAAQRVAEDRDFAIDQLRNAGASDIDKLFTAEDGPPIKFDGEEFPNTPLNRILARYPQILQITAQHADPTKAARQSFIARFKMAYQIFKQESAGVSNETAKQLVEAGRQSKDRENNDRARQSLNAGSGKSGVGTDKQAPKSYVSTLNALPGEVPLSSLLS